MRREQREEIASRPDRIRCGVIRRLMLIGARHELREYPDVAEVRELMARRGWSETQALYWLNTTTINGQPAQLGLPLGGSR